MVEVLFMACKGQEAQAVTVTGSVALFDPIKLEPPCALFWLNEHWDMDDDILNDAPGAESDNSKPLRWYQTPADPPFHLAMKYSVRP